MSEKTKSITVTLDYPFEHDGREVTQLTFRRMRAKDALVGEGENNQARAGYKLFAALAGVELAVIEMLDIEDLEKVGAEVAPLMGKSAAKALAAEKTRQQLSSGVTS